MPEVSMHFDDTRRFAFAMRPRLLRSIMPESAVGTYVLLNEHTPIYVGRSDSCVLTRLCSHELAGECTHVVWEPCQSALRAYLLEAEWYHQFLITFALRNKIHPARPWGHEEACPFCNPGDESGLKHALPHYSGDAEKVLADPCGDQLKNS